MTLAMVSCKDKHVKVKKFERKESQKIDRGIAGEEH